MTDIHTRIRELRNSRGFSMQQLAELVGVSWQTVQQWEKGSTAPKRLRLEKVALELGTSVDFLLQGSQAPPQTQSENFDANVKLVSIGMRRVPLINIVQAGQLSTTGTELRAESNDFLLTDLALSDRAFALEISGISMQPLFHPGDRVIIDQEVAPVAGDFVVARNASFEATFKKYRVRGITDAGLEVFELAPLNEDFPTLRSDHHQLVILGTMMEHRRYRRR